MFSHISHRMDSVKQVNSGEETAIGLAAVSEDAELSNSLESSDKTPGGRLLQVGRNDQSGIVSKRLIKDSRRSELTETSKECSWDLDPVLAKYAN